MATTEAAVLARVQDVLVDLNFVEAAWPDFSKTPTGVTDGAFALELTGQTPIGQIGYFEEVRATLQMQWLRQVNGNLITVRDQMLTDSRSIVSAVVRDGTTGDYAVEDAGRGLRVEFPDASYAKATLRVPINFEAAL